MYAIAQTLPSRARTMQPRVRFRAWIPPSLEILMQLRFKTALAVSALALATHAMAQVTFYEGEGYRGRAFSTDRQVVDFNRNGFNDRASSVVVDRCRWEVSVDTRFCGHCVV